jgi:hypothetical protein
MRYYEVSINLSKFDKTQGVRRDDPAVDHAGFVHVVFPTAIIRCMVRKPSRTGTGMPDRVEKPVFGEK